MWIVWKLYSYHVQGCKKAICYLTKSNTHLYFFQQIVIQRHSQFIFEFFGDLIYMQSLFSKSLRIKTLVTFFRNRVRPNRLLANNMQIRIVLFANYSWINSDRSNYSIEQYHVLTIWLHSAVLSVPKFTANMYFICLIRYLRYT